MRLLRALPLVLAALLAALPAAPPEHVHEVIDADGHHEAIAHRHASFHGSPATFGEHTTVGDSDTAALTLDDTYTAPVRHVHHPPIAPVSAIALPATADRVIRRHVRFDENLIHGPPRAPAGLRAPPALLS